MADINKDPYSFNNLWPKARLKVPQLSGSGGVKPVLWGGDVSGGNGVNPNNFSLNTQAPAGNINVDISRFGLDESRFEQSPGIAASVKEPAVKGAWTDVAGVGLKIGELGLGVYNALEQSKLNKFMRSYYGDQMDMMRTDFSNAARSANESLAAKRERVLSAQGKATGTEANKQGVAAYMDEWGVQENF